MKTTTRCLAVCLFALCLAAPPRALHAQTSPQEPPAPAPAPKEDARNKVFDAQSFMLDNGMQVVVVPNHRAPVVTHMVWYKVGAAMEEPGRSGLAHFLEHLMFKGSAQIGGPDLPPGEFSKKIRALGGQDNAFTGQDYTAYFQSVPAKDLETVMRMEAGRMRGLAPPEEEVKSEQKVVMEERRTRTDNDPQARFSEEINAHAYINHPYGKPVIGWMHEIEQMDWTSAKAFYNRWYAPNNAILVVTGDVTPGEVFAKAIDIYGPLESQALPPRPDETSPPAAGEMRLALKDPAVREPVIYALYRASSARQDKQEALALTVLAEIMGGGSTSRLYDALVTKQKIASAAGLSYDPQRWSDASLSVYATPLPGQGMETVENALRAQLNELARKGISEKELKDAVTRLGAAAIYARDSLSGPAMTIGHALTTGATLEDVEYWPTDLESVTREQVQAAARKYLVTPPASGQNPPVWGVLLPDPEGRKKEETKE